MLSLLHAEPVTPVSASLDPRVRIALGEDSDGADFRTRLRAINSLTESLGQRDAEVLFEGLIRPLQAQGMSSEEWAALYNDALNILNTLGEPLPDYTQRLIRLVKEEEREEVLRDYALQHLLSYIEFQVEVPDREELLESSGEVALAAVQTSLPATYLLGIYQMAGKPGYPNRDLIAEEALSIASDEDSIVLNRISSIQICAQLGYTDALPLALEMAKNQELRTGLRAASIAAVGMLGSKEHSLPLKKIKYLNTSDFRLAHAAERALQKLQ